MGIYSLNGASEDNHIYDMSLQIRQVILSDSNCYILVGLISYRINYPF